MITKIDGQNITCTPLDRGIQESIHFLLEAPEGNLHNRIITIYVYSLVTRIIRMWHHRADILNCGTNVI